MQPMAAAKNSPLSRLIGADALHQRHSSLRRAKISKRKGA